MQNIQPVFNGRSPCTLLPTTIQTETMVIFHDPSSIQSVGYFSTTFVMSSMQSINIIFGMHFNYNNNNKNDNNDNKKNNNNNILLMKSFNNIVPQNAGFLFTRCKIHIINTNAQ